MASASKCYRVKSTLCYFSLFYYHCYFQWFIGNWFCIISFIVQLQSWGFIKYVSWIINPNYCSPGNSCSLVEQPSSYVKILILTQILIFYFNYWQILSPAYQSNCLSAFMSFSWVVSAHSCVACDSGGPIDQPLLLGEKQILTHTHTELLFWLAVTLLLHFWLRLSPEHSSNCLSAFILCLSAGQRVHSPWST